jgi:hypothetical protein
MLIRLIQTANATVIVPVPVPTTGPGVGNSTTVLLDTSSVVVVPTASENVSSVVLTRTMPARSSSATSAVPSGGAAPRVGRDVAGWVAGVGVALVGGGVLNG